MDPLEMDPSAFTDMVLQNTGAEAADLQHIINIMNPTQLATSLQHMALQYRDMQNAATGLWDITDVDVNDDRAPIPAHMEHPSVPPAPVPEWADGRDIMETPKYDDEEDTGMHPRTYDERPYTGRHGTTDRLHTADADDLLRGPGATHSEPSATPQPAAPPPGACAVEAVPEVPVRKDRGRHTKMPAAKLETFAGQGASVEAFLAKFESHATYFEWDERDNNN